MNSSIVQIATHIAHDRLDSWLETDDCDVSQLKGMIANLPALSLDVLQAANADRIRTADGVDRLDRALILLGSEGLRTILRGRTSDNPIRDLGDNEFIDHSLRVARSAALLARAARLPLEEEVYTTGLFHDVGILLLRKNNATSLRAAENTARAQGHGVIEHEQLLLGTNHAEESARFLHQRGLPFHLTETVRFHHDPLNAPRSALFRSMILFLADHVAEPCRERKSGHDASAGLRQEILVRLRLSESTLRELSGVLESTSSQSSSADDDGFDNWSLNT